MAKKRRKTRRKRKKQTFSGKKRFILIASLALCAGLAAFFIIKDYLSESASFDSDKYFVKGIDVSHHNPILNWMSLHDQNISFAYIKATEGTTHLDRNYPYNYELAREANIKVGSYHFYSFTLSGKEQALHFLKTASFESGDLIPAIDVEHSASNPYSKDKEYRDLVVAELKILEDALYQRFGIHPILYTNRDCYKLYIKGNFPENLIWICDLHNEPGDEIPNWKIWQFSHKGELPGIDGHIDLNYYKYSFEQFKELLLP
ncbi:MAG: GH25 family lysozyme [Dysgonomonas sp.]|nr:GH25 family lysozyme [Dysgonomonas sp.]